MGIGFSKFINIRSGGSAAELCFKVEYLMVMCQFIGITCAGFIVVMNF